MYPVAELAGHSEYVNDVAWAPTSKYVHNVKKDLILFLVASCALLGMIKRP